jgi:hypothetical protein
MYVAAAPALPAPGRRREKKRVCPRCAPYAASRCTLAQASLVHDVEKQITELYEWVDTTLQDM